MAVNFRRYSSKGGEWHPTPFLVTVAERVLREIGFPVEFEKFEEMEKSIMEILKEEYMKADSKSLGVSEVCLSNKEFIEDEWRVKIEFYGIFISHDWLKNRKRLEDCYLKDVIEIYQVNQNVAALNEHLKELESKLMDEKVPYLVKLKSLCDDEKYCIKKFLKENKDICDYEKAESYKREDDYEFYTHEFVTENLPAILSFIRTKVL
ncbi:MAG: hypothetical protein N2505_05385, partial [Endomicrobia bacterium]|nr:hypothetical protein [Endomicrobiia bacterium]